MYDDILVSLLGATGSIPISLTSGQGIGQSAINALSSGAGAGIGYHFGGIPGAVIGGVGANALANAIGTDKNEKIIGNLGGAYSNAIGDNNIVAVENAINDYLADEFYQRMTDSAKEKALTEVQIPADYQVALMQAQSVPLVEVDPQLMNDAEIIVQRVLDKPNFKIWA